jgi:predicted nuclease with TOPRIM domain
MDEKEYRQMLEELKRDYEKKVEALNTVWEMYQNKGETTRTVSVADLMREAISKLGEPFHLWQVRNQIEADHPEAKGRLKVNTISGHLTRMQRRGELEVVKKGYGTQPSSYKKKVQT